MEVDMQQLKRHPCLQPLSRDHGIGLVCAQNIQKALRASENERIKLAEQLRAVCRETILLYCWDEQLVLSSLIPSDELRDEFTRRHLTLRQLTDELNSLDSSQDPGLGLLSRIADALDDYVRWEEHSLFPAIESSLSGEDLERLAAATTSIETMRHRPTQRLHASVPGTGQSVCTYWPAMSIH
jgi:hypothetical protein